jgi:Tfp pilus assembly protein PilF
MSKTEPTDARIGNERGVLFARYAWSAHLAGDDENAARAFRIARRTHRSSPETLELYGCWLARTDKLREAMATLRRVARIRPTVNVWCHLADVAMKQNNYRVALDAIERAVRLDPDFATPAGTRARVLARAVKNRLQALQG